MSKSLARVKAALEAAGAAVAVRELSAGTRTAEDAASAVGCEVDQIAKSIIFRGETSSAPVLFITAGSRTVQSGPAAALAGEPLGKADAALIRAHTGFAIGGVAPLGHKTPLRAFFDPHLSRYARVFAAAGTPRHVFEIAPELLLAISGATLGDFAA